MSYSPIIQNIIHQLFSLSTNDTENINILYDYSNSIFDKFIIQYMGMSFIDKKIHNSMRELLSYDIYWNNNPVEYISDIDKYKNDHLSDIVFFHEFPENNLKKEDKFLLQNRLRGSFKIYTNMSFKNSWSINDGRYIKYCIPDMKTNIESERKSVVILNMNNDKSGEFLYSHIKQQFSDTTILQDISKMSYNDITNVLQQHNICISFKKSFDSLVALSCGCEVLSSSMIEEEGITHIEDFNNINSMIGSVLKTRNAEIIKKRIDSLIKKYDLEIFQNELYDTIKKRIRKPFIL